MMQMLSCGHAMMQCPFVGIQWCKCPLGSMPWCKCPFIGIPWCKCLLLGMTRMLWCKHNLFKNSLLFSKRGFLNAWNQNIFKLNLLFLKSHLLFDLRLPKKLVITVRNLWMGHWFGIWWSGSKDLFSQLGWAKWWPVSMVLFFEKK